MPTPVAPTALTAITAFPPLSERSAGTYNQHAYDWATQMAATRSPELEALAANVYGNATLTATNAATATTQAGTATTQAGIATTQAGIATTQADAATTQAGIATTQAASVLAMDKRYLGSKASAPTLDNQGAALVAGAVYFNSTTTKIMTYTGSVWVEGITGVAGVESVNGLSGVVSIQTVPDFMFMSLGVI